MQASKIFRQDAVRQLKDDLADALKTTGETEILWVGRTDEEGQIAEVSAAARGNASMVPALFPHMSGGDAVIHNHPGGDLRPSGADLDVASRLGNQGIGFLIIDSRAQQVNVIAAPVPKTEIRPLDVSALTGVLEPGGALSGHLESYEARQEQIDLLRLVAVSFNNDMPLLAEAGTGVGKSFAYLLPSLKWAQQNPERVVISTATIALQQQLMEKDIPLAAQVLGIETKVALVKGRGNYLCLKRLSERGNDLFQNEISKIRNWANETDSGSRSELPFQPSGETWNQVRCEADNCPGAMCYCFDACFLMKARRKAAEASVLVANHHLLFADLSARTEGSSPDDTVVLPPYRRIILDEAHHAEESATNLFTRTLSLPALNRIFHRLHQKKSKNGLLARLAERKPGESARLSGKIPKLIETARARAETFDALGRDLLAGTPQIRLTGEVSEAEQTRLCAPLESLRSALAELTGVFADFIRDLEDEDPEKELKALIIESQQTCGVLQDMLALAGDFLNRDEYPDQIFWLESQRRSDGSEWLACHKTPLSVAQLVRESVWEIYNTVVGMSATLAVNNDFQHWKQLMGAHGISPEPAEGIFSSPFDYASRVLLGIPSDAPPPEQSELWEQFLIHTVTEALKISDGHALVLFTSYQTLRRTLGGVREQLDGIQLLAQGDDDRGRLLRRFREHSSSVLFATDSFWEGVDVPGDSLKMVILTRLPFRPPVHPVSEARREAVSTAGGNPFNQLTLPDAVTRFRQGFGRLIRRSDDHGAVLVLDPRICRKYYGPLFLNALPPTARSIKPLDGVLRDLENFLYP